MARKNYYLVLGVSREESPRAIQKAFRDLARQHHPDRAGPAGTPMFREVLEAYRVLSDPDQRRQHDAELRQRIRGPAPPLGPRFQRARETAPFDALHLFGSPSSIHPSAEDLFDRLLRNFTGAAIPKSEHAESLYCDIALSSEEARWGGVLPIRIPVARPCPACHAMGRIVGFPCDRCDGTGEAESEIVVPLEVPPGIRTGVILDASLDGWGIRNLWIRARVRVR